MRKAKEILEGLEFKNWKELRDYIVDTLSEKYGSGTMYHDIEKFENTDDKLNYYIKSEIIFYLDVYKNNISMNYKYGDPKDYSSSLVEYTLNDDIKNIKNKIMDKNVYPAVAMLLERIQEAYECYQFLEHLAKIEEEGEIENENKKDDNE